MKFSYQLYSSRNFPPLTDTLKELAGLGYAEVEGYGGLFSDVAAAETLRRDLDANELVMPTAHVGLDMIEADAATVAAIAKTIGIGTVFCPHIGEDQRPGDADGWRAFGARLAEAGPIWRLNLIWRGASVLVWITLSSLSGTHRVLWPHTSKT